MPAEAGARVPAAQEWNPTLKSVLPSALLLTAGVALLPEATAACGPGTDPDDRVGRIRRLVESCIESAVSDRTVRCE